jgi:hypothetical protein
MSDKIWIAHPEMENERPQEILEKQYYIWRKAGWRAVEAPPPLPTQKEIAEADIKAGKAAEKKKSTTTAKKK